MNYKAISKEDSFDFNNRDFARLEPPSFWANSEKFVDNMEGYKYCYSKYKGRIADDVLSDGAETDDDDVVENLERVARLREWVKHVEFGIDFDTNHSISRVCLGIGQGYTNWVPLYKMAKTLDPSLYIT